MEAKKNVLCEKPFVIDYEQAKNIKIKVEESKMLFLEALAYRSHPQIKKVISLINQFDWKNFENQFILWNKQRKTKKKY